MLNINLDDDFDGSFESEEPINNVRNNCGLRDRWSNAIIS